MNSKTEPYTGSYVSKIRSEEFRNIIVVPLANNKPAGNFPTSSNLIGFDLEHTSGVVESRACALFPVQLVNGVASMSSYPSAKVLQLFAVL